MGITWEQFDGQKFQRFCNELLLLEVSKHAHVYSAPGPDGGIDQLYSGAYSGKEGNWRFQDKFHLSGQASKDWSALKRDVASDIRDNYAGEQFIVFITNVSLSPAKERELLRIAHDSLAKRRAACEVIIWHDAFLKGIIPAHPVLHHWHWGNGSTSLKPFKEFFKASLAATSTRAVSFQNEFFGREDDFDFLDAFLASDETSTLAIVSNGGYGKTRLCIEFMQRIERADNEWLPLVLVHRGYNSNEFARLLEESGRLLILLDNANEAPDILNDVRPQVEATNGRVKLLLTTRNTLFNQTLGRMSSHNSDIPKRELSALGPEMTLQMLQAELPHIQHRNIIALRDISRGVPNVILELVAAVRNGENINAISSHNFFANAVLNIVREAANGIFHDTGIPHEKTIDVLQLLSIISPVSNETADIAFIAAMINLPQEKVETVISHLSEAGLVEKTRTLSIKPDPYSDVILAEACKNSMRLIERIKGQQGAERYVENIIKNLAEAEIPSGEKELFTQQMLRDYFEIITDLDTAPQRKKRAIELARDLSYTKPAMAVIAVNKWIELLATADSAIHAEKDGYTQKSLVEAINEIVADILGNVATAAYVGDVTKLPDVFALMESFIKSSGYFKALYPCFGFRHWHSQCVGYNVKECCGLQHFLKDKVVLYLSKSNDPAQIKLALEAHDMLMQLELAEESYYDSYTMTMHMGARNYLPDCPHAKEFRIESLRAVIAFYKSGRASLAQKQDLLPSLTGKLYRALEPDETRYEFNMDGELDLILSFLRELLEGQPEMWEKITAAGITEIWHSNNVRPAFAPRIKEIIGLAKAAGSLKEELELLLGKQDFFDRQANTRAACLRILKDYDNEEQFQEDFISISVGKEYAGTPHYECIMAFIAHEPEFSKRFLDRIIQHHPEQLPPYTHLISANYQDREYFSETTETILSKHPEHIGSVVWMMVCGRAGNADYYAKSDLDVFEKAINQNDQHAISLLDGRLINYAFVDKDKTFGLYGQLLPLLHERQVASTFHQICKADAVTNAFPEEIFGLIRRHLKILPLKQTFGGDEILSFVEEKFGVEQLYTFVRTWIEYKMANSTYGLFSFGDHRLGNKRQSETSEIERFLYVLRKFISLPADKIESRTERQLLKVFRPTNGFTELLRIKIMTLLSECKGDQQVLISLAKALSVFPPTTEPFVLAMCEIGDAYVDTIVGLPTSREIADFFGHDFCYSTGGFKIVPSNVHKKELFEKIIAENHFSAPIKEYMDKCIQYASRSIEQEIESDKARLVWR